MWLFLTNDFFPQFTWTNLILKGAIKNFLLSYKKYGIQPDTLSINLNTRGKNNVGNFHWLHTPSFKKIPCMYLPTWKKTSNLR